jgi:hypothetical protein
MGLPVAFTSTYFVKVACYRSRCGSRCQYLIWVKGYRFQPAADSVMSAVPRKRQLTVAFFKRSEGPRRDQRHRSKIASAGFRGFEVYKQLVGRRPSSPKAQIDRL